ncbi:hypothetical protein PENTCL1PPCAC_6216, partial [Pristionchus entomophagus]
DVLTAFSHSEEMEYRTTTEIEMGDGGGDLSECRSRLDASVEENRRNRHVIEEINEQIARFRRRNAEEDAMRGASSSHLDRPSTSNWHFSQSTNNIPDVAYGSGYGSLHSG